MKAIRKLFKAQYRLSVLYHGEGTYRHIYGTKKKQLKQMAKHLVNVDNWTLYKSGPLFLPERPIDWKEWEKGE